MHTVAALCTFYWVPYNTRIWRWWIKYCENKQHEFWSERDPASPCCSEL